MVRTVHACRAAATTADALHAFQNVARPLQLRERMLVLACAAAIDQDYFAPDQGCLGGGGIGRF